MSSFLASRCRAGGLPELVSPAPRGPNTATFPGKHYMRQAARINQIRLIATSACILEPTPASTKMLNTGETQNAKYCGRINPPANVIFSTLAYKTVSQQFNRE
jgi:hypothetical protein